MSTFFKDRRGELGMTQLQIAIALEITPSAVSAWDRGENPPKVSSAHKLAKVYQVTEERIIQEIVKLSRQQTAAAAK